MIGLSILLIGISGIFCYNLSKVNGMGSMWLLIVFGIVFDQLIKLWVVSTFLVGEHMPLLFGVQVHLVMNRGVALSLFAQTTGLGFYLLNMMIVAFNWVLVELLSTAREASFCYRAALMLVIAGGFSNLMDRVCYGAVVDYLHLHYAGWHWPAIFNLADVYITLGCVLLVYSTFRRTESLQASLTGHA